MPFFGDQRVMGCTRQDLSRWLIEITGSDHGLLMHGRADLDLDWGRLSIDTAPQPPRAVALLRLPQLEVRFRYDPGLRVQAHAWITQFDHHTQRGGG